MTEKTDLWRLHGQLVEVETLFRDIARAESDTRIVAAYDLAADYIDRARQAAVERIGDIEVAAIAAEETHVQF